MEEYQFKDAEANIYPNIKSAMVYVHLDHIYDSGKVMNVPVPLYRGKLGEPSIHSDSELRAYIRGCFVGSLIEEEYYEMQPEHYNKIVEALSKANVLSFTPEKL